MLHVPCRCGAWEVQPGFVMRLLTVPRPSNISSPSQSMIDIDFRHIAQLLHAMVTAVPRSMQSYRSSKMGMHGVPLSAKALPTYKNVMHRLTRRPKRPSIIFMHLTLNPPRNAMTALELEALKLIKDFYDVAKVRWRPLPQETREKQLLERAKAILSNI